MFSERKATRIFFKTSKFIVKECPSTYEWFWKKVFPLKNVKNVLRGASFRATFYVKLCFWTLCGTTIIRQRTGENFFKVRGKFWIFPRRIRIAFFRYFLFFKSASYKATFDVKVFFCSLYGTVIIRQRRGEGFFNVPAKF